MKSIKEWSERNEIFFAILREAIKDFKSESGQESFDNMEDWVWKGELITYGYCADFVAFLISRLLKNGIDESRIKVYEWEYIHVLVTVDDDIILDSGSCGVKFSRNKLNEIFLSQVASLAVVLNEHYYIVSNNGVSIIYDPWGFVDNQDFNHDEYHLLPSKETVYTVEEFKKTRRKND